MKNDHRYAVFTGATYTLEDEEKIYHPGASVAINPDLVEGYYDHTILLGGHKIRVMETMDEIGAKLEGRRRW